MQAERAEDTAKRNMTPDEALEATIDAEFAVDDMYGNIWCAPLNSGVRQCCLAHLRKARLHAAPACQWRPTRMRRSAHACAVRVLPCAHARGCVHRERARARGAACKDSNARRHTCRDFWCERMMLDIRLRWHVLNKFSNVPPYKHSNFLGDQMHKFNERARPAARSPPQIRSPSHADPTKHAASLLPGTAARVGVNRLLAKFTPGTAYTAHLSP